MYTGIAWECLIDPAGGLARADFPLLWRGDFLPRYLVGVDSAARRGAVLQFYNVAVASISTTVRMLLSVVRSPLYFL